MSLPDESPSSTAKPPNLAYAVAELPRAILEFACLLPGHSILANAPRGDGHPVFTLPGYRSNDTSMSIMRRYLARWGYAPHPWGLGTNLGVGYERLDYEERFLTRLIHVVEASGMPASLIGWSQGGVIAREIARARPDLIRQVITLGSPIADTPEATTLFRLFRRISEEEINNEMMSFLRQVATPLSDVRCICIYSRTDGIVSPDIAQDLVSPNVENICVNASHFGMTVNPRILFVIADRLAQPDENWRPFDSSVWEWLLSRR